MIANTVNRYEPNWSSLDARPCPSWYDEAKFGIFIHWGPYSVPSWAPKRHLVNHSGEAYAEWYGAAVRNEGGPYNLFHRKIYGERTRYEDFAGQFRAELFDPDQWAELFAKSGARYITLTSKHHDGFCLWPSEHSWNWNSRDIGSYRDLAGELASAVRARGLRMGFYYSLLEWFNPLFRKEPSRYALEKMIPQMRDLIERYEPSLLFTDGEWEHPSDVWHSREFLAWLFNESEVRNEIVVNDRWGSETRSRHGGYYTTEYGEVDVHGTPLDSTRKWEENRSVGASFGYNRNEDLSDYMTERDVIHLLADTVSKGGNLMLNVGPTADGRIPVIMQERLHQLGEWLAVNGEAIYGTKPGLAAGPSYTRFTKTKDALYAICFKWPDSRLVLETGMASKGDLKVRLLGMDADLAAEASGGRLTIDVPVVSVDEVPCRHAYVIKIEGA